MMKLIKKKLLVARNKKQCKELYLEIFQVLIKQDVIHKKDRRIIFLENTKRTIAGD